MLVIGLVVLVGQFFDALLQTQRVGDERDLGNIRSGDRRLPYRYPYAPYLAHRLRRPGDHTLRAVSRPERIVIASTGGWNSVSTQYRLRPLSEAGEWPMEALSASSFPTDAQLEAIASAGGPGAILILQRVLARPEEIQRLRTRYERVIFDIDDAIYAVPPRVGESPLVGIPKQVRRLLLRGATTASTRRRPLARTLRSVDACVVGNDVLDEFASRFARRVVEIPTTIKPVEHGPTERPDPPVLVWLGVRDNLQYLELIRSPLEKLRREFDVRLRIVSTATWENPPLPVDFVPFSEEAAREALLTSTAGIAPLTDDPWTRGKCALRAIQYGGHALPAVASPVGVTDRVIVPGVTGFLPRSRRDWLGALRTLVGDRGTTAEMGRHALNRIRALYADDVAVAEWRKLISSL